MKVRSIVMALLLLVMTVSVISYYGPVAQAAEGKIPDAVCGMQVDKASALSAEYEGKTYYFCSAACKANFDKDPKKFACLCAAGCKCDHCQGKAGNCACAQKGKGH
ncbi:MAG TPA: YHS domain-containing protein [Candidatus Avalokitesvara rifleensis]|uniref:YHS domain-containing protein n=1 Tax=Candidatus Avalokitesvara rifleensis TaxID=3367620 RepID=UPI002713C2F4|nr:YHS domain-containing protein [Candidatus Brocadiales bacterium]